MSNVPDDWGSYYNSCGCHASGGCSCNHDAVRPWLEESGYDLDDGQWSKLIRFAEHTCRRDHKDGTIKRGQTYRRKTWKIIDDDSGKSQLCHQKSIIKLN